MYDPRTAGRKRSGLARFLRIPVLRDPLLDRPMAGRAKIGWFVVALFAFLAVMFTWRSVNQDRVLEEFRAVLKSDVSYLMLCEASGSTATSSCSVIDDGTPFKLGPALEHLSQTRAHFMGPGKGSQAIRQILRFGRGHPAARQYIACYRLLHYAGANDVFIHPVQMNPDCTHVEKYPAGDLAVPLQPWLELRGKPN